MAKKTYFLVEISNITISEAFNDPNLILNIVISCVFVKLVKDCLIFLKKCFIVTKLTLLYIYKYKFQLK